MARPAKHGAELRTVQKLRIDFYKVADDGGGPTAFASALRLLTNTAPVARAREIQDEPVTIYALAESQTRFDGEIGRLRMTGTPFIGTRAGERSAIPLNQDQGIVECTVFSFSIETSVLTIHTTREGISASRLASYCDAFNPERNETFVFEPVLRSNANDSLRAIQRFRKIDVKFAGALQLPVRGNDISTMAFLRGARKLKGQVMSLVIGSGQVGNTDLDLQAAKDFIAAARRNEPQRLVVSGKGAADESLTLDLISNRLRESRTLKVRGRSSSFEARLGVLHEAYSEHLDYLKTIA